MIVAASTSWPDAVSAHPLEAVIALGALSLGAVVLGLVLRASTRHARSLRNQVLAIALASLAIGAAAAVVLARLMILAPDELRTVAGVLGVAAVFSTVLVFVASSTLGRDVRRLEASVRRIETGEPHVSTGLRRHDELGHVARALDELMERLDTLERERSSYEAERRAMLSNVGHDLRTPLSALQAAIEALADGVAPDPERYLRSMQRDIEAITALVEDLFLLSSIEAGRLDLHREALDLAEIADEAVEALTPSATERQVAIELRAAGRVQVNGNATAIGRVIRNLVDNAIRHAPSGTTIDVVVTAGDGNPSVQVIDQGPGFPAEFSAHAFERFARADPSRTRSTGGAGLGLAIAQGLVEAQGGRIWIEEQPGGRVAFDLPAA